MRWWCIDIIKGRILSDDIGQALIEFVFAIIILSLAIFGIIELTTIYSARFAVSYSGFMGARSAAVHSEAVKETSDEVVKTLMAALIDPKLVIPGLNSLSMTVSSETFQGFVKVSVSYRKPVKTPIIARAIDPIGSLANMSSVRLWTTATLPLFE